MLGLLIVVSSLVSEHSFKGGYTGFGSYGSGALEHRLGSCGTQA